MKIEKEREYRDELFKLMHEHPELPVLPMVWEEVVVDDCSSYWLGSWGKARIEKYYQGSERIHFYDEEDWGCIECCVNDSSTIWAVDELDDEKALELYRSLPWMEAIVVYIEMPE